MRAVWRDDALSGDAQCEWSVIARGMSGWSELTTPAITVKVVFSPLDRRLKLSKHTWSPQTIQQAVRLAVEIPSHRRAAATLLWS